jgi:hypothetical protein
MFSNRTKTAGQNHLGSIKLRSFHFHHMVMFSMIALLMCGSFGCRCVQTFQAAYVDGPIKCYRDRIWAERAYNVRFGKCNRTFGKHFERGFIEGYCSVSEGGDGFVPAMPPQDYWGSEYQTADGAQCVNTWFEGYPAGAAAAKKDKAGNYHEIYISKMMDSAITQINESPIKKKDTQTMPAETPETTGGPEVSTMNAPIPVIVDPHVDPPFKVMPVGWEMQ